MLGLIGTVAGATALEFKRLRKRGSIEELKEFKKKERELRELLEVTNQELAKVKQHSEAVEVKAHELEAKTHELEHETCSLKQEKAHLEQRAAELGQQREQLQQNNSKLVLTNLMIMHKAKHLEDNSRALIAKQEDLQHQLEQLQRDQQAAEATFESSLSALKDQVTAVLNRYFSKDIDLQQAMSEMQGLGIEVVPVEELQHRHGRDHAMEFETKLVLDSPHRMHHLMSASMKVQQLTSMRHDKDVPKLAHMSFPMGISKDPTTGAPRITLAWRTDPQAGAGALPAPTIDSHKQDQQHAGSSKQAAPLALKKDTASSDTIKAEAAQAAVGSSSKVAVVQDGPKGQALTFASPQKQQSSSGFSLGFGGFGSRRGSSNGDPKAYDGPALLSTGALKSDDDVFLNTSSSDLVRR